MKAMRSLAGRLPWLVLGIGIGAVAVWLGRERNEDVSPPAPDPGSVATAPVSPTTDDPKRARRIGIALARIKPGMTRREVEAVLGAPDLDRPQQFTSRWRAGPDGRQTRVELQYVVYYCSPPHLPPGTHLMTVEYESKALEPIAPDAKVAEVSGPHSPDNCG